MPHAGRERQHPHMVIALLAVLGVDLIVIVAVLAGDPRAAEPGGSSGGEMTR
jgi:hypothetical protein